MNRNESTTTWRVGMCLSIALALWACDSVCSDCPADATIEGGVCDEPGDGGLPLYPLEADNWWVYRVCDPKENSKVCPHKLVRVGAEGAIPWRSGQVGFPVQSLRPTTVGRRWQAVGPWGTRRLLDEWFDRETGERTSVKHFCPYKSRIDDGDHACQGARWSEEYVSGTLVASDAATLTECAELPVDPITCTFVDPTQGCSISQSPNIKEWFVKRVGEPVAVPAGAFTAMRVELSDEAETSTFWWARGVGKVKELTLSSEHEVLLDYCLAADGCMRPPPSEEALAAACDAESVDVCINP